MLSRLLLANFYFAGTLNPSLLPEYTVTNGRPVLPFELVHTILDALDITYFSDTSNLPKTMLGHCFNKQYQIFGLDYIKPWYLTRKGFCDFLFGFVLDQPEHMWRVLNQHLDGTWANVQLLDPLTDSPFEFTTIPRRCFPLEANAEHAARWNGLKDKMLEILRHWAQVDEEETAEKNANAARDADVSNVANELALARLDLALAKQESGALFGGEYIDERGYKRQVMGAMDRLDDANW